MHELLAAAANSSLIGHDYSKIFAETKQGPDFSFFFKPKDYFYDQHFLNEVFPMMEKTTLHHNAFSCDPHDPDSPGTDKSPNNAFPTARGKDEVAVGMVFLHYGNESIGNLKRTPLGFSLRPSDVSTEVCKTKNIYDLSFDLDEFKAPRTDTVVKLFGRQKKDAWS